MTYHPKSEFIAVMINRGFLADCTDYQGLDEALMSGTKAGYIGFDATAKSLHVGSLIQIMILVHIAGVLVEWLLTRDNLVAAMIGGRKPVDVEIVDESVASNAPRDARGGSVWLALAVAIPLVALGGWLFTQLDPTVPRPESGPSHSD